MRSIHPLRFPICDDYERCYSAIERYVWDGDQILWEFRQPGAGGAKDPAFSAQTGHIGYVHGTRIDQPLGMIRNDTSLVLHQNYRGHHVIATTTAGAMYGMDVPWPAGSWDLPGRPIDPRQVHTWVGSLPMGQEDHTGLNYRRNRYYDPGTGQFTQSDPIGIAGGLNLYGYANGDPINFSDPFGLFACPEGTAEPQPAQSGGAPGGERAVDYCEWLVEELGKLEGEEFKQAAAAYRDAKVPVYLGFPGEFGIRKARDLYGNGRGYTPESETGEDLWVALSVDVEVTVGDFLIAAVHESYHLNGRGDLSEQQISNRYATNRAWAQLPPHLRRTTKFYGP